MLPDHLLALESLLVLLQHNQLLVLHILQLVLKIAELPFLVLHLPCGCLEVILELLLLVHCDSELVFQADFDRFRLLVYELGVFLLLLDLSLELLDERFGLFGYEVGPI